MTEIPEEAVEAAARALYEAHKRPYGDTAWMNQLIRDDARREALLALTAALPLLRQQWEQERRQAHIEKTGDPIAENGIYWYDLDSEEDYA